MQRLSTSSLRNKHLTKSHARVTDKPKRSWSGFTPAPPLTFEEGGKLIKADETDIPLTLNALLRIANSNLSDKDYTPEKVAGWLGFKIRGGSNGFVDIGNLVYTLPKPQAEVLLFAQQTCTWWNLINTVKTVLNDIAKRNSDLQSSRPIVAPNVYGGRSYLTIDATGKATPVADPVLTLFKDMDTTRIRKCPICEGFFWAGRITSWCCSKRCNNTRLVRESRSEEKKARAKELRYRREERRSRQ